MKCLFSLLVRNAFIKNKYYEVKKNPNLIGLSFSLVIYCEH